MVLCYELLLLLGCCLVAGVVGWRLVVLCYELLLLLGCCSVAGVVGWMLVVLWYERLLLLGCCSVAGVVGWRLVVLWYERLLLLLGIALKINKKLFKFCNFLDFKNLPRKNSRANFVWV